MSTPRIPRWARWPLALLPGHVRDEHGRELAQLLDRDHAGWSLRWQLALLWDVLRAAPAAHWDVLRQDLGLALRQARRAPGFALVSIVTLALGIGANVLLFSLVDGVLLRPLPYRDHAGLVEVTEEHPERGLRRFGISPANLRDLTADSTLFAAWSGFYPWSATVKIGDAPDQIGLARVGGDFFRVFTDPPFLGRVLGPEDDVSESPSIVVSHAFWTGQLAADLDVLGREIEIDGARRRIVGVMPPHFQYPAGTAIWQPLALGANDWSTRGARYLGSVARLEEGVPLERARRAVAIRAAALARDHRETNDGWTAAVRDVKGAAVERARAPLLLVWAAGGLVLLIALANVASLLLGRAVARGHEMALRRALGARSGRIARQVMTEGLVLALLGGLAGLALARLALWAIGGLAGAALPRFAEVSLSGRVLAFTLLLVGVATVLFSSLPALAAGRTLLWRALQDGRGGDNRERTRWQGALVVGEVAVAVFVLVGSALVVRTLVRLLDQPLGFEPNGVITFRTEPPWRVSLASDSFMVRLAADRDRAVRGFDLLATRLGAAPGVTAVGAVSRLPLTGQWWLSTVDRADRPAASAEDRTAAHVRVVMPRYLDAMGTRLLRGRDLSPADLASGPRVALIDQTLARKLWGDTDPLGAEILIDGAPGQTVPARVVGIVEPVYMSRLDIEPIPAYYVPMSQAFEGHYLNWGMDVVIRGGPVPERALREAVGEAFPDAAVFRVRTMERLVTDSVVDRRFQLLVLGLFAVTALVLTMVGVGGVLLLAVRRRRRELGVRLALGANPWRVGWLVQRQGFTLVGLGTMLGLGSALAAAKVFESLVYGVSARDPIAFAAGPAALALAAFVAALTPSIRAMRIDPVRVLREE